MLDEPFGALDMFTREELWLAAAKSVADSAKHRRISHP
jgi:ABC-type nitrate/sulfonate/bicarbonate transport system ATPase subunit